MPIPFFRLARGFLASGLLVLATFASAQAQETSLDPNATDIPLPKKQEAGFHPVSQLAAPENDYPNCSPAAASWHPPIFYPNPTLYCSTGLVARDWFREKLVGFHVNHRQRMLEKDYAWRVRNGCAMHLLRAAFLLGTLFQLRPRPLHPQIRVLCETALQRGGVRPL